MKKSQEGYGSYFGIKKWAVCLDNPRVLGVRFVFVDWADKDVEKEGKGDR